MDTGHNEVWHFVLCSFLNNSYHFIWGFLAADEYSADISQNKMHWYNLTSAGVCICIPNLFSQVSLVNIPVAMMDISLTTGLQTAGLFKYAMS